MLALAVSGCERAGADLWNNTQRPVAASMQLLPGEAENADAPMKTVIAPGDTLQSVWRLNEHQRIAVALPTGREIKLEGASLHAMAMKCPRHCIIEITPTAFIPHQTDLFGNIKRK